MLVMLIRLVRLGNGCMTLCAMLVMIEVFDDHVIMLSDNVCKIALVRNVDMKWNLH